MPKVTFTQTRTVNDGSDTTFEAGQTYELPTSSCERWIKRGVAGYAEGSSPGNGERVSVTVREPRPNLNKMTIDLSGDSDGETVIPADWADLPWVDLLALAKSFDPDVRSKEDAIAAVELELEKRAKK